MAASSRYQPGPRWPLRRHCRPYDEQVPRRALTIYLHIGPPKTGTTYLQDIVWRNRDSMRQRDLAFPGRPGEHFHAALDLRGIAFGGYDNPTVAGAWSRLAAKALASPTGKALASPTGKALISHEILAGATPDEIERAVASLRPATVQVVYGARDLARQLPAVWQESLKNRRSRGFDAFLSTALRPRLSDDEPTGFWRAQDPVATLRRWAAVLSPEHIHVVTLPQPGAPATTLWERFCTALGVDPGGVDVSVARVNGSLSVEDAEVLRRLNRALPDNLSWPAYERQVKRRFNARANARASAAVSGNRLTVPDRYREVVEERAVELRDGLAAAGYNVVGDLDDLFPAASSFGTPTEVPADRVTDAAVDMLAAVLAEPDRRGRRGGSDGDGGGGGGGKDTAKALLGRLRRGRGGTA